MVKKTVTCRQYGPAPFSVVVVHGGPGAAGGMAPVARKISKDRGVLEPLQTSVSLKGQVAELKKSIEKNARLPVVLIGHSWGAFLGFIFTAAYPRLVGKLILVGSGPFEAKSAKRIMETRLSRLSQKEGEAVKGFLREIQSPKDQDKNQAFFGLGRLLAKADSYELIPHQDEPIDYQSEVFKKVWPQAEKMRSSGDLLALGKRIHCPVVAIHGDYDSHPAEGVSLPLSSILSDFTFLLLERCGHEPWFEKYAKDRFFHLLRKELA